jgi:hypothetical protein
MFVGVLRLGGALGHVLSRPSLSRLAHIWRTSRGLAGTADHLRGHSLKLRFELAENPGECLASVVTAAWQTEHVARSPL